VQSPSRRTRTIAAVTPVLGAWTRSAIVCAFVLAGCAEDVPRLAPSHVEDAVPCAVTSARDGVHFFALSFAELPEVPAPFAATITFVGEQVSLEVLPLYAQERDHPAIDPATGTQAFGPFPVEPEARVTLVLHGLFIPEGTNPFGWSEMGVDARLRGAFCRLDEESLCGDFAGESSWGVDVEGTWTMTPIVNGKHREPPPLDCAGNLAAPL
jgi:hypothetical protein